MSEDVIRLEHQRVGDKVKVTARSGSEVVHIDTLNPANAARRKRFAEVITAKKPLADSKQIEIDLLRIAEAPQPSATPIAGLAEVDVSRVVRPEMFYVPEVSGLAVPVVGLVNGKPAGRWKHYLRWSDGRRECRDLESLIDLPDGSRLWVHHVPGDPSVNTTCGWSAPARRAWLAGSAVPAPADLFKRICERIAYFLDLPQDTAVGTTATVALWSMLSYCFPVWDAVPYLYVGGPAGSGKSTLFGILARLVHRPLQSSNLTAPALFRTLDDRGGVLLFDEAERLRQTTPEVGEIMSMLLAGYKRDGQATRLEKVGETFRTTTFDVYGLKALACIVGLPPALASRCIAIMMFRAGPDSPKPKRRIDADPSDWQRLRDDLHALALEYGTVWLNLSQQTAVCPDGIDGRSFELWQPISALASWIESHGAVGLLEKMQRHALASIDAGRDDQIPDADEMLLEILTEEVRASQWVTNAELLAKAQQRDPSTFGKWGPRTISNRLKAYGIVARKRDKRREYRDVSLADLVRIQRSYGIDLGLEDTPTPETASLSSPFVPEAVVQGRNGTKRDET